MPLLALEKGAAVMVTSHLGRPTEGVWSEADSLAPVAARLSLGLEPSRLGPQQDELVRLDWAEARVTGNKIEGSVQSVDSFGNLITDISADALANAPRGEEVAIHCDDHETHGIFNTYADQPEMTGADLVARVEAHTIVLNGQSQVVSESF